MTESVTISLALDFLICTMAIRPALPVKIKPDDACESELNQSMQMKVITAFNYHINKALCRR